MANIESLRGIMRKLRDRDHGCPWDLEQTFASIVPHTLEEAYEVADVIETGALDRLPDELGDLLFQIVFYCQIAEEQQLFSFDEVVRAIEHKLIKRHPHVFAGAQVADADDVALAWEARKAEERSARAQISELDDVPRAFPALTRARKIQKRAARVGFDWPHVDGAWDKLREELTELQQALQQPHNRVAIEEELGDLLFATVNVARHLALDPEHSLRAATRKFEARFRRIEEVLAGQQRRVESTSAAELDRLWEAVKLAERGSADGTSPETRDEGHVNTTPPRE